MYGDASLRTSRLGTAGRTRAIAWSRSATGAGLSLAHEPLARRADERDRLGEEDSHRVPQRERLLVGSPAHLHLRERRRRELDGGVERQRRELLALRLLDALGLLLGELAQAPKQILRIAAEREAEATTFHATKLPERKPLPERELVPRLDLGDERVDDSRGGAQLRRGHVVEVGGRGDTRLVVSARELRR